MSTEPAKRVPKSIGTDAKLFGSYTLTDLMVGLFPGVVVVLATQLLVPATTTVAGYRAQQIVIPLAALATVVGGVFVYLTPTYTSSIDWVASMLAYLRRPSQLDHDDAKEYTQLERVHQEAGAVERTDGAFVGIVQVTPPMLALATDDEWTQTTEAFQRFLNTTVEFPLQFYSTTRSFPVEEYLSHYERRLTDSDVKANPQLAALIEEYIEWYGRELDSRQMTIRDHYVVVSVRPEEVQFERESITQQLAGLPVLGLFIRAIAAPPIEKQRLVLQQRLDERLRRVSGGLREIDGCTAYRVPVEEATELVEEFWAGTEASQGQMEQRLRTTPVVGGAR
ncbi:hypothetical protein [Haloarchaeobius litoreus]|uniref:PrgI family protein n=1 Tax=Haloarchaeobius litoreus TaxID=755306 RepID=A0ABD6DIB5_9EURY|nr:hypothetical protein [Haloarchaeobius litoreus]